MRRKGLGKLCGFVLALMMLAQPIIPTAKSVAVIISAHSAEAATTISKPLDENKSSSGKNNNVSFTNNGEIRQNSITLSNEERAKNIIETLQDAGIVEKNGKMVDLDVRENGKRTSLSALANKILRGESTGNITVNGNSVTPNKILQLQQASSMLDTIDLINTDVKITDEHVSNLQTLLEDIVAGDINLSDSISDGEQVVRSNRGTGLRSADPIPDNTGTGEVDATNGTYTAPYISGSTYNSNYEFTLNDPDNTTWYTESTIHDGVITLTCDDTAELNSTVTVTATLNKVQSVPVSFDWSASSDVITLTGTTSGTMTWKANDTQLKKSFTVTIGDKSSHWVGSQCMVINASNLKNAEFGAGNGTYVTETCWSKIYQFSANESDAVLDEYPAVVTEYPSSSLTRIERKVGWTYYYFYYVKTSEIPSTDRFTVTVSSNETITYIYLASTKTYTTIDAVFNSDLVTSSDDYAEPPQIRYKNGVISNAQYNGGRPNDDTKATLRDSAFSSASERAAVLGGGECWLVIQHKILVVLALKRPLPFRKWLPKMRSLTFPFPPAPITADRLFRLL